MPNRTKPKEAFVLFAYGFRPFVLAAGIYAAIVLPLWLTAYLGAITWNPPWPAGLWHAHEMVFGFAVAALSGFLLTAIPNWTGTRPCAGARLACLTALWLAGRIALWVGGPAWLVAAVDLAYLPALAVFGATPLWTIKALRNRIFLVILGLLTIANGLMHLAASGAVGASLGGDLAIDALAFMIAIVGGRVIPAFTTTLLADQGAPNLVRANPIWDKLGPLLVAVLAVADVAANLGPEYTRLAGLIALCAAFANGQRMRAWATGKTLRAPIVWVLHLGYAWLVAGLAAKGLAGFGWLDPKTALHALTIGAVGTMPIAIMSRAALGHTGRPLVVAPAITLAYVLVSLAAISRMLAPLSPTPALILAGTAWTAAFAIFSLVHWPILTRPRVDGKPG